MKKKLFLTVLYTICSLCLTTGDESIERPAVKACREIEEKLQKWDFDKFAFHAAIEYRRSREMRSGMGDYGYRCGGVLITNKHILTLGTCMMMYRFTPTDVLLGLPRVKLEYGPYSTLDTPIKTIHIHPDFVEDSTYNNIAVIELEKEVRIRKDIHPICLHTGINDLPSNASLVGSGSEYNWGQQMIKLDKLIKHKMEIIPQSACNETFAKNNFDNSMAHGLEDSQICVDEIDIDPETSCETVSGSPVSFVSEDAITGKLNYRLVGLKMIGFDCESPQPEIYTKVSAHLDFIENIVWPESETK